MEWIKKVLMQVLTVIVSSGISILIMFLVFFMMSRSFYSKVGLNREVLEETTVKITLDGDVVEFEDFKYEVISRLFPGSVAQKTSFFHLMRALRHIQEDDKVQRIVVDVASLSIGWAQLFELVTELKALKENEKEIHVFLNGGGLKELLIGASGNYRYTRETADFYWTGFYTELLFFKGLVEKLDAEVQIFKVGKYKSAVEPFVERKMSAANREQLNELLESLDANYVKILGEMLPGFYKAIHSQLDESPILSADFLKSIGYFDRLMERTDFDDFVLKRYESKGKKEEQLKYLMSWESYMLAISNGLSGSDPDKMSKIAMIFASGEIFFDYEEAREGIASSPLISKIKNAYQDEKVKGIIIRVDSPGGDAYASDHIFKYIQELSLKYKADSKKEKPIFVSFGNISASGGYYLSAGANKIFASPMTITGSIGVFGLRVALANSMKRNLGVTNDSVQTYKFGHMQSPFNALGEKESQIIQNEVETTYNRFLSVVQKGRQFNSIEEVGKIAQGRVYTGSMAQSINLVDELAGLNDVIDNMKGAVGVEKALLEVFTSDDVGFADYLPFPFSKMKLSDLVRSYLKIDLEKVFFIFESHMLETIRERGYGVFTRMEFDIN